MSPSPRKVLIINDTLALGGAEHQLYLLAKYLPKEWERRVWFIDGGPNAERFRSIKIPFHVHSRKWKYDISPAFDLWEVIRNWHPDIVHAWGWMSCIAALPICKVLGIPLINGTIRKGNLSKQKRAQWLGLRLSDGVIANSRAGLNAWNISGQKSNVIYNGFDPERLCLIKNDKKVDKFTVVMVGRMEQEKDFINFIDSARLVTQKGGYWRFLAVGSGPDRSYLVDYANDLVKSGVINFPEIKLEVLPIVASADVGVLLTTPLIHEEGCSNAIMEYMASQLPVVCTFGGGNPEIVVQNKTGFLIQPGDPIALAERLTYLYDNRYQAREMGVAGYERFLEMFSIERMVNETAEFYCRFLKEM